MKTKTIKCYRFVTDYMRSEHDKNTKWKIGEWKTHIGNIETPWEFWREALCCLPACLHYPAQPKGHYDKQVASSEVQPAGIRV